MAKLHFFHSVMNAGKSAQLLFARHNYEANGYKTLLFTSTTDTRGGESQISSRLGISAPARALSKSDNLFEIVRESLDPHARKHKTIVFVDEVQFLSSEQIRQSSDIVDHLGLPVLLYGLKNNVFGELFSPAVATALACADDIKEIKQVCHCGRKATMILRFDRQGRVDRSGDVVKIGAEEAYVSVCRPCFKAGNIGPAARASLVAPGAESGPVVCGTCDNVFESIPGCYESQQAYRCSAVVNRTGLTGYYGSTVADGDRWEFVDARPERVKDGNICDACITSLQDEGLIRNSYSAFGSIDELIEDELEITVRLDDESEED